MQSRFHIIRVEPDLPEPLRRLRDLALNLRWTWHAETRALFRNIDPDLWREVKGNPVLVLARVPRDRLAALAHDAAYLERVDHAHHELLAYLSRPAWFQEVHRDWGSDRIAYFSAEFGISECLPLYSGGLGILAGDHMKSASDLGLPLVGIGLAYRVGYLTQSVNGDGWQQETFEENDFEAMGLSRETDAEGKPLVISVPFPGREVNAWVWRAQVGRIPLILLDTNVPSNTPGDREITHQLYGGGAETRIQQELVLGIGGLRALGALDLNPTVVHINEGHPAFLLLQRWSDLRAGDGLDLDGARLLTAASTLFTTHTPVPAGIDRFDTRLLRPYLEPFAADLGKSVDEVLAWGGDGESESGSVFNMALFAIRQTGAVNGVSRLHGRVARRMWKSEWPEFLEDEVPIGSITNGVHTETWVGPEMAAVFDRHLAPSWRGGIDPAAWDGIEGARGEELWEAHRAAKRRMVNVLRLRDPRYPTLDPDALTLGFARRFAPYKRATLLLREPERLKQILTAAGRPVQILFAGKSHPANEEGKRLIQALWRFTRDTQVRGRIVFLENYDMDLARQLVEGVDVWLNTPRRPYEASGTSGMKAALNGVLNVSVLDGWWNEAYSPEVGWAVGRGEETPDPGRQDELDADALFSLLENDVIPCYYDRDEHGLPRRWLDRMRASIRRLAPAMSAHRMVREYAEQYYVPGRTKSLALRDGEALGKAVSWRERVLRHWPEVEVKAVETTEGTSFPAGSNLPLTVRVQLGELRTEDVAVEIVTGPADGKGRVSPEHRIPLSLSGTEAGEAVYRGELHLSGPGRRGFAVRVSPAHPVLAVPVETHRATWYEAFRGGDPGE
jgi:starch phosphorylase